MSLKEAVSRVKSEDLLARETSLKAPEELSKRNASVVNAELEKYKGLPAELQESSLAEIFQELKALIKDEFDQEKDQDPFIPIEINDPATEVFAGATMSFEYSIEGATHNTGDYVIIFSSASEPKIDRMEEIKTEISSAKVKLILLGLRWAMPVRGKDYTRSMWIRGELSQTEEKRSLFIRGGVDYGKENSTPSEWSRESIENAVAKEYTRLLAVRD